MNEKVKNFLITQGVTERDIEYRGNFTFLKVELMLLNALKQGQTLPIDSVVEPFYCYDETVQIAEETGNKIIKCDKQCEKCKQ